MRTPTRKINLTSVLATLIIVIMLILPGPASALDAIISSPTGTYGINEAIPFSLDVFFNDVISIDTIVITGLPKGDVSFHPDGTLIEGNYTIIKTSNGDGYGYGYGYDNFESISSYIILVENLPVGTYSNTAIVKIYVNAEDEPTLTITEVYSFEIIESAIDSHSFCTECHIDAEREPSSNIPASDQHTDTFHSTTCSTNCHNLNHAYKPVDCDVCHNGGEQAHIDDQSCNNNECHKSDGFSCNDCHNLISHNCVECHIDAERQPSTNSPPPDQHDDTQHSTTCSTNCHNLEHTYKPVDCDVCHDGGDQAHIADQSCNDNECHRPDGVGFNGRACTDCHIN